MSRIMVLRAADVRRLLPMAQAIALVRSALEAHARGDTVLPLRPVLHVPDGRGSLYVMPAWLGTPPALAVKLITLFPGNAGTGRETHQGVVVLFDDGGAVSALVEAGSLTAIRTAAVSAAATAALAREDASQLAILGSGVQARSHLEAMCAVRPIRHVRVWSRTPAHAERFAAESAAGTGLDVVACETAESAVRQADIVCTVTAAQAPVLAGAWLRPGTHINAVGASTATTRELDADAVARARVFVDSIESASAEAGDLILAREEGRIGTDHVAGELGALLLGRIEGRQHADDVTLFESLGLAIEDAGTANYIARAAATDESVVTVDFGGNS